MYAVTTVTTPATSFNLTTLLAVLADLDINDADGPTKVHLQRLIAQSSGAAARYCRRVFALQTYQDVFRLQRTLDALILRRWPVTEIGSISVDGIALAPTGYECDGENGLLRRLDAVGGLLPWCGSKIIVNYDAGYILPGTPNQESTLPPEVEDAVIRMSKGRYLARERDPLAKSESVDGVGSVDYGAASSASGSEGDGNITPDVAGLLEPYRFLQLG